MGVCFKPGGAFPFLGVPSDEFRDAHVSLDAVWGARAGSLRDRLLEAGTPEARFRILEQSLAAQISRPLDRHPAVAFAIRQLQRVPQTRTLSNITDQIGLSHRRFIHLFRKEVGLTPKLFYRVRRFQEVLRRIGKMERVDWAGMAVSCGYFDQAHFIDDFRAFSGVNPSAYLTHRGHHPNHIPLSF